MSLCFSPLSRLTMDEEYDVIVLGTGLKVRGGVSIGVYCVRPVRAIHSLILGAPIIFNLCTFVFWRKK